MTVALSLLPQNLTPAAVIAFPALLVLVTITGDEGQPTASPQPPWWDTPVRMAVAVVAVVLITGVALLVGPTWSGLLATLPVFAAVMGVFSHRHLGQQAARAVLRGIAVGAPGAAMFFLLVSVLLEPTGIILTYTAATAGAVMVASMTHLVFGQRRVAPGQN